MRSLLCWCIWLFVSNQMLVAGGWWSLAGKTRVAGGRWSVVGHNTLVSGAIDFYQPVTSHRPPVTNSPATDHLPCTDSSPTCLETLGDLAVQNSRELAVLEQAIQLQKKKLWTNWLSADGLNPLAIALRIARNVAGGGERAAAQLELARLELRRTELVSELREAVARLVFAYETAQREMRQAQTRLTAHQTRLAWLTISYRLGEGSTETMLQLWQQEAELQAALEQARANCDQHRTQLEGMIFPPVPTRIPATNPSQKS